MKAFNVFVKTLMEAWRDPLGLSLTLIFSPLFVLLYWLFTAGGSTTYSIAVINQDAGAPQLSEGQALASEQALEAIKTVAYANGQPVLKLVPVASQAEAEKLINDRTAVAFLAFPKDFSQSIQRLQQGDDSVSARLTFGGDLTNPYYMVGVIFATSAVDRYVQQATGQKPLIEYIEKPLGASGARTEFENYIPGLFVFAVIMMIFLASMVITREVERGTFQRLQLTRMTALDFMAGVTAALTLVGLVSALLTFLAALAMGFHSQGSLGLAILVITLTCISMIGTGLIIARFSRTVTQAFLLANFPLGIFMFFSGAVFPMPRITLFTLAERPVGLYDILPPTHAVAALNKIFTLGAGVQDILYELSALTLLSLANFAVGVWLFHRHLRKR